MNIKIIFSMRFPTIFNYQMHFCHFQQKQKLTFHMTLVSTILDFIKMAKTNNIPTFEVMRHEIGFCSFVWWCLMPLSTIYRGGQFYWWRTRRKPTMGFWFGTKLVLINIHEIQPMLKRDFNLNIYFLNSIIIIASVQWSLILRSWFYKLK